MSRYIIGLGLPRSGTTSLAALLDGCDGASVTHEGTPFAQPWPAEQNAIDRAVEWLRDREGAYVGDVGYYWLPYVLPVYRRLGRAVTFTAVVRPETEWHGSFLARVDAAVLASDGTESRKQFPTYRHGTNAQKRRRYYRAYLSRLYQLRADGLPLTISPTGALNVPRRILRTSGIARADWTVNVHHKNERHP